MVKPAKRMKPATSSLLWRFVKALLRGGLGDCSGIGMGRVVARMAPPRGRKIQKPVITSLLVGGWSGLT